MAKSKLGQITAYGTDDDKNKVKALATREGRTVSDWIVHRIRREYVDRFGPPTGLSEDMKRIEL